MLSKKPPMGWNTWNTFGNNINENLILDSANAILTNGLDKLGYNYIVIDDCWAKKERDKNGKLVCDEIKFPNGIKSLAEKIHKLGLKFGIYSCSGFMTCASYPGSYDHEWTDAKTFAEWKVDFLKYDYCYKPIHANGKDLFRTMGLALNNCGRDILFSACSWGADLTREWIRSTGANMWRSTGDIFDGWNNVKDLLTQQASILPYGGINCFNDMDMLIVGMNGKGNVGISGCTEEEYKTHFAAWCMLGSPLMIGCDVRSIDEFSLSLLKNEVLLSINQDELCAQPFRINYFSEYGNDCPVYARLLANGDIALGLFNLRDDNMEWYISAASLGVNRDACKGLILKDCWTGEETYKADNFMVQCPPHASMVYRIKIVNRR